MNLIYSELTFISSAQLILKLARQPARNGRKYFASSHVQYIVVSSAIISDVPANLNHFPLFPILKKTLVDIEQEIFTTRNISSAYCLLVFHSAYKVNNAPRVFPPKTTAGIARFPAKNYIIPLPLSGCLGTPLHLLQSREAKQNNRKERFINIS